MVDVNPRDLSGPYTPRESTIVDSVAEARRIADQLMRNNPLVNSVTSQGFTRFRGNYDGQNYLLLGEFYPADANLLDDFGVAQPQRGFHLQRDDPSHNQALSMYDFDPKIGVPLRQRLYMRDASGHSLMLEGYDGGRAFPDTPIVMYQRESFENPAATWTADRVAYSGEGSLTGTRLDFSAAYTCSVGTDTINNFLRASGGGVTINTATSSLVGSQNVSYTLDLSTIYAASDYLNVEWHMWRSAGTGSFLPRIYRCRNFSPFTDPTP